MTTDDSHKTFAKTPAEKLAEALARKTAAQRGAGGHAPRTGGAERAAAALSASKSKPAPRKG